MKIKYKNIIYYTFGGISTLWILLKEIKIMNKEKKGKREKVKK